MKKNQFLKVMDDNNGRDIVVEVDNEILQKMEMQNYTYQIIEDKIYFRNTQNLNFIVINLNTIRYIQNIKNVMNIYLDDNIDTKVKISVI